MEQSFLAYLRGRCRHLPQVAVGIGDDAAVLDPIVGQRVICTDQIIDGVDFDFQQHSLHDVGYKAMAVNLSDLAAMGAVPESALVTLALPRENATRIAGDAKPPTTASLRANEATTSQLLEDLHRVVRRDIGAAGKLLTGEWLSLCLGQGDHHSQGVLGSR